MLAYSTHPYLFHTRVFQLDKDLREADKCTSKDLPGPLLSWKQFVLSSCPLRYTVGVNLMRTRKIVANKYGSVVLTINHLCVWVFLCVLFPKGGRSFCLLPLCNKIILKCSYVTLSSISWPNAFLLQPPICPLTSWSFVYLFHWRFIPHGIQKYFTYTTTWFIVKRNPTTRDQQQVDGKQSLIKP